MLSKQYIAGFVDGEAYFGIRKHTHKMCSRGYTYNIVIKIAQKKSANDILYRLKELYEGDITHRKHNGNQQESSMWEISGGRRVENFIKDIYKHLIVKKEQADVLKKYIKLGNPTTKKNNNFIFSEREKLYNQIRELNYRGLAETE